MKVQSINNTPTQSFGALIIHPGSFEALRHSKYFPDKSYPQYNQHLIKFCRKIVELKKISECNNAYNVVVKPDKSVHSGKIVIENSDGFEQTGFTRSFRSVFRVRSMEPAKKISKEQEPSLIKRFIYNQKVNIRNKKLTKKQLKMEDYLDIVANNVKEVVLNANYLASLREKKQN